MKINKHKWVTDESGKECSICGSRLNTKLGFPKHLETDLYGIRESVRWYPRCQYNKTTKKPL